MAIAPTTKNIGTKKQAYKLAGAHTAQQGLFFSSQTDISGSSKLKPRLVLSKLKPKPKKSQMAITVTTTIDKSRRAL